MTAEERLSVAKLNLQRMDTSQDELITHLLLAADYFLKDEGLVDDGTTEYDYLLIMYACYLFRKRDADTSQGGANGLFGNHGQTGMPRFLRWAINNMLMKQRTAGV